MKFTVNNEEHILDRENFGAFFNDEEKPVKGASEEYILSLLEGKELDFEKAYYSVACQNCNSEKTGQKKAYKFYEYHFYLYTKDGEVVTNSLILEDSEESFEKLLSIGKVDNSYIVSIIVCADCGDYEIDIEEFEI